MRKSDATLGYWKCEAPLTSEQRHEDMRLLSQIQLPEEVFIASWASYWVNAHLWEWRQIDTTGFTEKIDA